MIKDFNGFIESIDIAAKGKSKKAKSALHYIQQLKTIDRFYVLFVSLVEDLSNSCNSTAFDFDCVEKVEYFRIPKSRAKGVRIIYDVSFDLKFGSPFSCYLFEKGYSHVISRGPINDFVFNKKLEDKKDVYVSFFNSISDETKRNLQSFLFEQKSFLFFYDIDEEDRNVATANIDLQISVELEKLNV